MNACGLTLARLPTERTTGQRPLLPLEVQDLSFDLDGSPLLDGIDLCIADRPACTAIMGPNGAGKSLLLRLLNGLIEPTSGSIRWNGRPPDISVRQRQAFVFQRPVLLRRSVRSNIDFVLKLNGRLATEQRRQRIVELIRVAGLEGRDAVAARQLSGGEQQRLALACALAVNPDVLLLDEPTASLDPAATAAIEKIVRDCRALGISALFVTHDAGQARRLADDVIFLARGRVTEHTPAERFFDVPLSSDARHYLAGHLLL